MNQIWLIIIALAVAVTAGFAISLIIDLKRTTRSVNEFISSTEATLRPTLDELQQTLKSLRNISDDLNDVTSDMKTLSSSIKDVGINIKQVSNIIEHVTSETAIKATSFKAGIRTGLGILLQNLFTKKGGKT